MATLRAETRYAKQLFLYGTGDGSPVRNVVKLAELSGVHEQTIRVHLAEWEKEAEEIIAGSSDYGLAVKLSKETLEENEKDLAFIRDKMNSIRWEIDNLDDCIASLENICENFSLNSDNGDKALRIFEDYLRSSMNRRSLLTLFLTLKKEWDTKSAVDGMRDIVLTREKEVAKGQAKLEIKRRENEPKGAGERQVGGGVFDRGAARPARITDG